MAVTLKQISKAAGVTTATVSRALNGKPGVGDRMRARIRRIAQIKGEHVGCLVAAQVDSVEGRDFIPADDHHVQSPGSQVSSHFRQSARHHRAPDRLDQ